MSEDNIEIPGVQPILCGCGREVRYSHTVNGKEVMSCNKRMVCLTYEEQQEKLLEVQYRYIELLYAVARKFPGESRHETALRYIKAAEERPPCEQTESVCSIMEPTTNHDSNNEEDYNERYRT